MVNKTKEEVEEKKEKKGKKPTFAQKIFDRNVKSRKIIRDKLNGISILPFEDPVLQWVLGGFNRGKLNMVYGPKGSGKSTLLNVALGTEQKLIEGWDTDPLAGWVVIIDTEGAYEDPHELDDYGNVTVDALKARHRFTSSGIRWQKVLLIKSNRVDKAFSDLKEINELARSHPKYFAAILVDSWGGVQSEQAVEKLEQGKVADAGKSFGGNSKTIGPIIQYLLDIAMTTGTTMYFVQHCMQNMKEKDPIRWLLLGGQKLQFLCNNILFLESAARKDAHLLEGEIASEKHADIETSRKVGKLIYARCEKSRNVVEGRKAGFWMNFETCQFAMKEMVLAELAKNLDVIKSAGAWMSYPPDSINAQKWQGLDAFIGAMKGNPALYKEIFDACMEAGKTVSNGLGNDILVGGEEGIEGGDELREQIAAERNIKGDDDDGKKAKKIKK